MWLFGALSTFYLIHCVQWISVYRGLCFEPLDFSHVGGTAPGVGRECGSVRHFQSRLKYLNRTGCCEILYRCFKYTEEEAENLREILISSTTTSSVICGNLMGLIQYLLIYVLIK